MTNGSLLFAVAPVDVDSIFRISAASVKPSISGICMSSNATANSSPRWIHCSASPAEAVSHGTIPHDWVCSDRTRRLVALSSTINARLPLNSG